MPGGGFQWAVNSKKMKQDKLVNLQNYEKLLSSITLAGISRFSFRQGAGAGALPPVSAIFAGRRQLLGRKGAKTRGKI